MSKFFRIKSRPKINLARRETTKVVSSENSQVGGENVGDKEDQLGKALEQQLSQKCEVQKETTQSDSVQNPIICLTNNDNVDKSAETFPNPLVEEPANQLPKHFCHIKSKPKLINTRREISFKNDSLENDQVAEDVEKAKPTKITQDDPETNNEKEISNVDISEKSALQNHEESIQPQKGFSRVKTKPKFNVRSKTLQGNKSETVINDVFVKTNCDQARETDIDNKDKTESLESPSKKLDVTTLSKYSIKNNQAQTDSASEKSCNKNVEVTEENNEFQAPMPVQSRVEINNLGDTAHSQSTSININNLNNVKENQLPTEANEQASSILNSTDRPPPPLSPTKINRIKAVPRFSESDGSRQHGRIRNISVCSVTSAVAEGATDNVAAKEVLPMIQKKINRTEQSRKLAEARKEFQKRFGLKSPDKQKLKMIDLIFYNPTTNPMAEQKDAKQPVKMEKMEHEKKDDEEVDNPTEETEHDESEKNAENEKSAPDDDMPVPQIKIGPNGEIMLDEQSLVIENKDIQKQKDDLQMSDIVDGDCRAGYGIFKRTPRSKDWTYKETLRFYKALNVIGTDFSLMVTLFPNRNRRELKTKFKKEEKVNGNLIGKAVTMPCCYNYEQLQQDFREEQEEEKELRRIVEEEARARLSLKQIRKEQKTLENMKPKKRHKQSSFDELRITCKSKEFISDTDSNSEEEEAVKKVTQKDNKTTQNDNKITQENDKIIEEHKSQSDDEAALPTQLETMPSPQFTGQKDEENPHELAEEDVKSELEEKQLGKEQTAQEKMEHDVKTLKRRIKSFSDRSRIINKRRILDSYSSSDEEENVKRVKNKKVIEEENYGILEDEESESEEETALPILLPTRSGRLPKSKNAEQALLVSMPPPQLPGPKALPRRRSSSVSSTVSNESTLENAAPGSIMVMTEDGPDGKPVYKTYMVTPERSLTPLNLASEVIEKVIGYKPTESPDLDETNVTIPASHNEDLRANSNSESDKKRNVTVKNIGFSMLRTKNGKPVIENENYTVEVFEEGEEESQMEFESANE